MKYYSEFFHYLEPENSILLLSGFLVIICASLAFKQRRKLSLWLLFAGVCLVGSGFALMDPYLNEWDEQYHALVAKNLSETPLTPVLIRQSLLPMDYKIWIYNHIWLHKQPLFLWQIALSVKLFGANIWAVRFPGILIHALTTLLAFSISRRILSERMAFLAAVLYGCSGYYNDFVSGAIGMDQNDVAFVGYVTASLWAWIKYSETTSNRTRWLLLIGAFAGCAVLCKWLAGLLVFAGWGVQISLYHRKEFAEWLRMLKAVGVCLLVALPWQVYCLVRFPKEYLFEMNYNSLHFSHALENHGGDLWFYWDTLKDAFGSGELVRLLLLTGLGIALYKGLKGSRIHVFATTVFLVVYLIFTFAATKMTGYVTIVAPLGFVFLLLPLQEAYRKWQQSKSVHIRDAWFTALLPLILFVHFSPKKIMDRHKYSDSVFRNGRRQEIAYCLTQINAHPGYTGYFMLKGNHHNILPNVLFLTNARVVPFTEDSVAQSHAHYVIDCDKLKRTP